MRHRIRLKLLLAPLLLLAACREGVPGPQLPFTEVAAPAYFPEAQYRFEKNPLTQKGFELGRRLFYDPILSIDSTVSCASCHKQSAAFSDPGLALSPGVNGLKGTRNSPALFNLAWNKAFMWDGGVNHIEIMPLAPITNPVEMNQKLSHLMARLKAHPEYPRQFREAFGKEEIDDQQFFYALAQFMGNMVSANAPYDEFRQGIRPLSASEEAGRLLFEQTCSTCHATALFTDHSYHNNGLESNPSDTGLERIDLNPASRGKFKTPSLRNIALTAPYMHDGRFQTLREVLDFYDSGVKVSPTLDPALNAGPRPGIPLTEADKQHLLSFLNCLTDSVFVSNPMYQAPR
ncbi:MAG: cytochrome-c peroxidase [Bacteroidetes bacterium]|nr:MAG: cytochrome-c peroxidase [Bacteroidota bacterium]